MYDSFFSMFSRLLYPNSSKRRINQLNRDAYGFHQYLPLSIPGIEELWLPVVIRGFLWFVSSKSGTSASSEGFTQWTSSIIDCWHSIHRLHALVTVTLVCDTEVSAEQANIGQCCDSSTDSSCEQYVEFFVVNYRHVLKSLTFREFSRFCYLIWFSGA